MCCNRNNFVNNGCYRNCRNTCWNSWWYQNADGTWLKNKWETINHHWYLFGGDGYIKTGWHRWNPDTKQVDPADGSGDWYYLQEDGDLQGACWHSKTNGAMEVWYVEK